MTFSILSGFFIISANAIAGRALGAEWGVRWLEKLFIALMVIWPLTLVFGVYALIPAPFIFVALSLGHGQYFLNATPKWIKPERIDFMLVPFFGKDPRTLEITGSSFSDELIEEYGARKLYWRNVCGMGLKGLFIALAPLSLGAFYTGGALFYALSAPLMSLAYMIGYKWFASGGDKGTVAAEWLNGAFRGVLILAVFGAVGYG